MNPNPGRRIALAAYDGSDIPNAIDSDPSAEAVEYNRRSIRRGNLILQGVRVLGPPTGRYNCHGLVFASRRTNIPPVELAETVSIDELLAKDQCERTVSPQLGDIIIYRSTGGDIDHSGLVIRIERVGAVPKVFVWSKWGVLEECEHEQQVCPYRDCAIEYWRLKDEHRHAMG